MMDNLSILAILDEKVSTFYPTMVDNLSAHFWQGFNFFSKFYSGVLNKLGGGRLLILVFSGISLFFTY